MKIEDRIKSILSECEYGYISYDNLHGDDDKGIELIKEALQRMLKDKISDKR